MTMRIPGIIFKYPMKTAVVCSNEPELWRCAGATQTLLGCMISCVPWREFLKCFIFPNAFCLHILLYKHYTNRMWCLWECKYYRPLWHVGYSDQLICHIFLNSYAWLYIWHNISMYIGWLGSSFNGDHEIAIWSRNHGLVFISDNTSRR